MMDLFTICLFVLIFLLQRDRADWSLSRLRYEAECDTLLAEPNQVITLTSRIENQSLIPVLYVHVTESLPPSAELLGAHDWIETHVRHSKNEVNVKNVENGSEFTLDKTLTEELKREGYARDLIRAIQSARKHAGLNMDDHIKLSISASIPEEHLELVKSEVLADTIAKDENFAHDEIAKVGPENITISLEKI